MAGQPSATVAALRASAALLEVTGIRPLAELAAPVLPPQHPAELFADDPRESMTQTGRI